VGSLVVGQPALRLEVAVSVPLDLVSGLSLLFRAIPGSDLDLWLIEARQRLPPALRDDLDLLHGFSGRRLYYPEEPVMRFQPLRPDRVDASFDDLLAFLESTPAEDYVEMVAHALERVHADLELRWSPPTDEVEWRAALAPARTTARSDDVMALIADPGELKRRTINLYRGVWDLVLRDARREDLPMLREAGRRAGTFIDRGFAEAYAALTGQRVPEVLERPSADFTRVVFSPSAHLGEFVSFIAYEPDLVVYFDAPRFLGRCQERDAAPVSTGSRADLLEVARALADPTRLSMIDLLLEGELYAQEIVGRLGVAQSAISRHLSLLERAGLVTVESRRGSKYYAVNPERLHAIAAALLEREAKARQA
jgi:DNA-binding transcriptional ArsR family regulator